MLRISRCLRTYYTQSVKQQLACPLLESQQKRCALLLIGVTNAHGAECCAYCACAGALAEVAPCGRSRGSAPRPGGAPPGKAGRARLHPQQPLESWYTPRPWLKIHGKQAKRAEQTRSSGEERKAGEKRARCIMSLYPFSIPLIPFIPFSPCFSL